MFLIYHALYQSNQEFQSVYDLSKQLMADIFEGIPYGQPPLGDLRFTAPLPGEPWQGTRDCLDFKVKPVQINKATGNVEGSEDCLYLNVFSKELHTLMLLPVMVYIYGGGFNMGAATRSLYSPDYFMQKDVVVVTLNYRVDSLGFLSVKDPEMRVPGNAGLKDQLLALKWIKKYIRYFNGDPDNITLFGSSVGSASVHYLTATNQSRGLFHKAFCMSGTMLNSRASTPPKDYAFRLAQQHGYLDEDNDRKVIEYLRSLEAEKLVQHDLLTNEDRRNGIRLTFAPVVEPYESENCMVPMEQTKLLHTAWGNHIPIIFGGTADEGLLLYSQVKNFMQVINTFRIDPATILPYAVKESNNEATNLKLAQQLYNYYFGGKYIELKDVIHYYGIRDFWHGFHRTLHSRLTYAKAPTYLFRFAFDSPTFNHYRKRHTKGEITTGIAHADDLSYLWYGEHSWKLDKSSAEFRTIQIMIGILTNFAKNRNHEIQIVSRGKHNDGALIWSPLYRRDLNVALNVGDQVEIIEIPEKEDLLLWDSMYVNIMNQLY